MKIACLSFTEKGAGLGDRIVRIKSSQYDFTHIKNKEYEKGIKGFLKENWNEYDGFIFISATGIAVRYINPYIEDKTNDPAILVMDDLGRFCISLLSGHLGGANKLTEDICKWLKALPVITTATDGRGIESVDMFAKKNNYHMKDMASITTITSLMVNDRFVGLYTEDDREIDYGKIIKIDDLNNIDKRIEGLIIVSSSRIDNKFNIPSTQLVPRNINIGVGCRRGMETRRIIQAVEKALLEADLLLEGLKDMGTIEVKKDELGIIEAAEHFNIPLHIFSLEEVGQIDHMFEKSQFVKDTIGVYSVSEPVAYLLGREMITRKSRYDGITISISRTKGDYDE